MHLIGALQPRPALVPTRRPPPPDVARRMLATFAKCCMIRPEEDRVTGTCRLLTPNGPIAFSVTVPLAPIEEYVAQRVPPQASESEPEKVRAAVKQIAVREGAHVALRKLAATAVRVNPTALSPNPAPSYKDMATTPGYVEPFAGRAPLVGPGAEVALKAGADAAHLLPTVTPIARRLLDRYVTGDKGAVRTMQALGAKEQAGDGDAQRALAQIHVLNRVRVARTVARIHASAIAAAHARGRMTTAGAVMERMDVSPAGWLGRLYLTGLTAA